MANITKQAAIKLAEEYLRKLAQDQTPLVIMDEYTLEKPYGYIFSYNTAEFSQTKNWSTSIIGGGPLIITHQGAIHQLPSFLSKAEGIKRFEEEHGYAKM